ncbi:YybH family protein [Solimonas soli]|uniref:YybH family protein n=1 Tax=Solimonas soli TaxID=413479 RepID=UPI0004BB160B|nr:nuclear transport factor 2 family protein [Solimonas soli]
MHPHSRFVAGFRAHLLAPALTLLLLSPWPARAEDDADALRAEVAATERAFARSMADRDFAAFQRFLADDAVFVGGPRPLRGKPEVAAAWKAFFDGKAAPFSWQPQQVEVLASGTLALSRGPVHDPAGQRISGFSSIWRREAPGVWKIVFDQGAEIVDCPAPSQRKEP